MITLASSGTGSVERAFLILEFLNSSKRGWNISDISRRLSIPKSTTHVLVSTLEQLGYVQRYQYKGSRRYQVSTKTLGLGKNALSAAPLSEIVLPHLHWLVQETRLTAHMGILERNQAVFVQKVDGPGAIKFNTYIGKRSELHCTGVGKVLLAFQPDEQIELLLSTYSFGRFTKKTISSKSAFLSELARVQQSGYSIDDEEEELGIRCIAAPILSGSNALAAVSVTGTAAQLRTDGIHRVIALTKCAAERISAAALTMSCSA